ncbi:MAG: putative zinc ribbon domain protein, partial [Verrucomicrobiales bacterium]|nr:putative zinc ribbon domain protein [Verrucomicrobiales bacterium]
MTDQIEKLLILQDRDRKIFGVKSELARFDPERRMLLGRTSGTQAALDAAKLKVKQIESDRKKLELDAEAKKGQIEKYSLQQFQTKKNEEYRALGHEIDHAKAAIVKLEDEQIELMEQMEAAQKLVAAAQKDADEAKKLSERNLQDIAAREENIKKELAELEVSRDQLTSGLDESTLTRYSRLMKQKGENVVVGIQHGVCGGCHMKFPMQVVLACQQANDIVTCPNCGRILYYTRDMD